MLSASSAIVLAVPITQQVPAEATSSFERPSAVPDDAPTFVREVTARMFEGLGDDIPVSKIPADGTFPSGTAVWEKRNVAEDVPVWEPDLCVQCGQCATHCVLNPSAVKCVHKYAMCGHCKLCFGYFQPGPKALNTGAENQMCPTGAVVREFVNDGMICPRKILIRSDTLLLEQRNPSALDNINTPDDLASSVLEVTS